MLNKILLIGLVVAVAVLGWQLNESGGREQVLAERLSLMEEHAEGLEMQVLALNEEIAVLKNNSVESIVKGANKNLLQGWENLLNSVQKELGKVKEKINTEFGEQKGSGSEAPSPAPQDSGQRT